MTRPEAPPGLNTRDGPAVTPLPGHPHHASSSPPPQRGSVDLSVPTGTVSERQRAAWLRLSDERDLHLALRLAAWREAYRLGYQEGHDTGYRTGYELAVREWKITAAGMIHLGGPTYAEQDRRRYPPGGRLSWIIPRPGEDTERQHG